LLKLAQGHYRDRQYSLNRFKSIPGNIYNRPTCCVQSWIVLCWLASLGAQKMCTPHCA